MARVGDRVINLLPIVLTLFLISMCTWLIMDNLRVTRTLTDADRSAAVVATVVRSEGAGRGGLG